MKKATDALPCGNRTPLLKISDEIISGGNKLQNQSIPYFVKFKELGDVCKKLKDDTLRKNNTKEWVAAELNFPDLGFESGTYAATHEMEKKSKFALMEVTSHRELLDNHYEEDGKKSIASMFASSLTQEMTDQVKTLARLRELDKMEPKLCREMTEVLSGCCMEIGAKYHSIMTKEENEQLMENIDQLERIGAREKDLCPMLEAYAVCMKKWILLYDLIETNRLQLLYAWDQVEQKSLKLAECYERVKQAHETEGSPEYNDAVLGRLLKEIGAMLNALNDNIALLRKELEGKKMPMEDIFVYKLNYLLRKLVKCKEGANGNARILDGETLTNLTEAFSEIMIQMKFADLKTDEEALAAAYTRESWGHALNMDSNCMKAVIYTMNNCMTIYSGYVEKQKKNRKFKENHEKKALLKFQFKVFLRLLADSDSQIDNFGGNISRIKDCWKNMGVVLYFELKEKFYNQDFWHEK